MSNNRPVLAQLDDKVIRDLPIDQIELLLEELATLKADATRYGNLISCEMSRRFADQAQAERRLQCKDTGTVRLACGDNVIEADLPKEVDWDQKKLSEARDTVMGWDGEDASYYVDVKYSVQERKFTAWPKGIQRVFEPARTVKTGKATYKIKSKKEEA